MATEATAKELMMAKSHEDLSSMWFIEKSLNKETIASNLQGNLLRYLSADIIRSEKRTVFRERRSRKTGSFEEQIMSKDKYPSIFSRRMEAIVFIIRHIFFRNERGFENWGILLVPGVAVFNWKRFVCF